MKKFGKRKIALMLACAPFLAHVPKSSSLTKNQKITAGVVGAVLGGGAVLATAYYLIFGKNNKNIVKNMTKEELQNKQNKISYEYGNKNDNNYIEENIKQTNIIHEPIVKQNNQIKSAGIQNNSVELDNLINRLEKELQSKKRYELGEKGKVFVSNPVLDMNVENINAENIKETLKEHLKKLCQKLNITQGMHSGDDDYKDGWSQPAWKYFFVYTAGYEYSNTYSMIDDNYKKLLAQCIEFMYQNMNNAEYNEILHMCIEQMSRHGGHCDARAKAITNTVYDMLVNFLRERGKIKSDSLMSDIFCTLKGAMIKEAVETYLKVYAQINDNRNMQHREPLYDVNALTSGLKYLFGMPGGSENDSKHNATKQSFGMQMHAETFIRLSQMIIYQNDQKSQEIKAEMDKIEISFKEYFEYTEKPEHWLKSILTKIWNYQGEEGQKFREWIKGNRNLKLGEIVGDLPYIFDYNDAKMSELKYPYGLEFLISCVKNGYLRLANDN